MPPEIPAHLRRKKVQRKTRDWSWIGNICHKLRSALTTYDASNVSYSQVSRSQLSLVNRDQLLSRSRLSIDTSARGTSQLLSPHIKDATPNDSLSSKVLTEILDDPSLDLEKNPVEEFGLSPAPVGYGETLGQNVDSPYVEEDVDQVDDFADDPDVDEADAIFSNGSLHDEIDWEEDLANEVEHEIEDENDDDPEDEIEEEEEWNEGDELQEPVRSPSAEPVYVELSSEEDEHDIRSDDEIDDEQYHSESNSVESEHPIHTSHSDLADDYSEEEYGSEHVVEEDLSNNREEEDLGYDSEEDYSAEGEHDLQELEREKVEDSEDADAAALDPNLSETPAEHFDFELDADEVQRLVDEFDGGSDIEHNDDHSEAGDDMNASNGRLPIEEPLEHALTTDYPDLMNDPETAMRNDAENQAQTHSSPEDSEEQRPATPSSPGVSKMSIPFVGFDFGPALDDHDLVPTPKREGSQSDHVDDNVSDPSTDLPVESVSSTHSPQVPEYPVPAEDTIPETVEQNSKNGMSQNADDNPYYGMWNLFNVGFNVAPEEHPTTTHVEPPSQRTADISQADVSVELDALAMQAQRLVAAAPLFGGTPRTSRRRRESILNDEKEPDTNPAREVKNALDYLSSAPLFGGVHNPPKIEMPEIKKSEEVASEPNGREHVPDSEIVMNEAENPCLTTETTTVSSKTSKPVSTEVQTTYPAREAQTEPNNSERTENTEVDDADKEENPPKRRRLRPRAEIVPEKTESSLEKGDLVTSGRTLRHRRTASTASAVADERPTPIAPSAPSPIRKRELRSRTQLTEEPMDDAEMAAVDQPNPKRRGRKPKGTSTEPEVKKRPGRPKRK